VLEFSLPELQRDQSASFRRHPGEDIIQHQEGWFTGHRGVRLYRQSWLPDGDARAAILLIHGLFEHSGRYANLVNHLVPQGYAICSFDQRGHGKSDGLRGYVERFDDFMEDLQIFHGIVLGQFAGRREFIFGHSIGGTIGAIYMEKHQSDFAGCILSAAIAMPGSSVTRSSIAVARALSAIFPRLGIVPIDGTAVSRDKRVVDAYSRDPLVYRGKIRARLGAELINVIERDLPAAMANIEAPLLLIHGTQDRLSNTQGSSLLYGRAKSGDKTLKYYEGLYHEVLNEPERGQVLADISVWLDRHAA